MSTVFVEKEDSDSIYLKNTSGADLVKGQFTVLGGKGLIASAAIVANAQGGFEDADEKVFQIADFVTAEGTFGTANASVYWDPSTGKFSDTLTVGYYRVGSVYSILSGGVVRVLGCEAYVVPATVSDVAASVAAITALAGRPFRKTVTLSPATAGTAQHIVAAAEVTGSKKVFVEGFLLSVGGATAWTDATATILTIQDTASSPVVGATFAKAQLTSQAQLGMLTAGVTLAAPIRTGVGFTAAKGLDLVADANFAAGSDISVTVFGTIE